MTRLSAVLAGLTVVSFVVGVWVATATPGPLLSIDDIAYLSLARTLAGEGAAPLGPQAPYGVLYPALLAPGWLLGLGEDSMLLYARVLNAACGALLLPTLYGLVRALTTEPPRKALAAAAIGASLPALWLTSSIAWTERLLALLVALTLWTLARMWRRPTLANALAVAGSGIAVFAAHPRSGPLACLAIAAVWLFAGPAGERSARAASPRRLAFPSALPGDAPPRRLDESTSALPGDAARASSKCPPSAPPGPGALLGVTALGALGLTAAELARVALARATFASHGTYDVFDLAQRRGVGDVAEMAQRAGGTLAYVVLAATALVVPAVVLLARSGPAGKVALAVTAVTVAGAGWFLAGGERADTWLHGRYVEVLAPVLLTFGVVAAPRVSRRFGLTALIVAPIAAGAYAAWAGPGDNWLRPRAHVMMLGVEPAGAPFGAEVFEPGAAASVSVLAGFALWLGLRSKAATRLTPLLPALFALLAGLGVLSGLHSLDQLYHDRLAGRIEAAGVDLGDLGELHVDVASASSYMASAMVWEVGFDVASAARSERTTHVLLGPGAPPPHDATAVLEFPEGTLWQLG